MNIYLVPVASVTSTTVSSTLSSTSTSVSSSVSLLTSSSVSSSLSSPLSSTSTSTTVSATPTPSIPATIGQFTYLNCQSDNVTTRTLQGKYVAAADMTLEHCAGNCTGYAYFGVEYMQEVSDFNFLSTYALTDNLFSVTVVTHSHLGATL